jgi:hypothetical protein
MKTIRWSLTLVSLAVLPACDGQPRPANSGDGIGSRKNVREVEPASAAFPPKAGQTIYVAVYSSVSISDNPHLFNLAINLSFRNTDQKAAVIVKSVRYYDGDGTLIRDYTPRPMRVGPLASVDYFIKESDKAGGQSACFLVDWIAEDAVTDPIVEAVMIGTANTQGVSFTCQGRVLADLRRP